VTTPDPTKTSAAATTPVSASYTPQAPAQQDDALLNYLLAP
jgi:hypothetical protein